MQPPTGLSHPLAKVYLFHCAFCGLKQTPCAWFAKFTSTFFRLGYSLSSYDSALFIFHSEKYLISLLLYVGGMIVINDDLNDMQELKEFPNQQFEMKDLGHLSYFFSLEVTSLAKGFYLTQVKYVSTCSHSSKHFLCYALGVLVFMYTL